MKKSILTLAFLICAIFAINAQATTYPISGYVTETQTGFAVANHAVYISSDSANGTINNHWSMVYTNANGYYSDNVNVVAGTLGVYSVFTADCNGVYLTSTVASTSLPMTADFSICTGVPTLICQAGYYFVPDSANSSASSSSFSFFDTSSGYPTTWMWNFGDGSSSNIQNPVHSYQTAGYYSVCLTIATANGCSSTFCDTVFAATGNPVGCQADFYPYPDSSQFAYYFYDYSTGVSNTTNYLWDFGDGTFSLQQYPHHIYANTGVYMVCLTISDSLNNCASTYCDSVLVDTINNTPCYSAFQYSVVNSGINFYGYANNSNVTYLWDFGDGSSDTGQNIFHSYSAFGTYYVCLTTTTSNGCSYTYCDTVNYTQQTNNSICGQIFAGANILDAGNAYLIGLDSLSGTYSYSAITTVDSSGYYCFFNIPVGTYIIIADPSPNSIYYNDYLPTYYGDVINWSDATLIYAGLGTSTNGMDIHLVFTPGPVAGNGSISGNVIQAGAKLLTGGDPIANVEIVLMDNSNNPLATAFSDANGHFAFSGIALGSYKIYGEYAGLQAVSAVIELTTTSTSVNNVQINVGAGTIAASVEEMYSDFIASVSEVYPNPSSAQFNISVSALKNTTITISITDMFGKKVFENAYSAAAGSNVYTMNGTGFSAGIYTISIKSDKGKSVNKLMQKIK